MAPGAPWLDNEGLGHALTGGAHIVVPDSPGPAHMNNAPSSSASSNSKRAAVLDVGSNSFLLVVGQACDGGPLQILSQDIRMPRLAQGMQAGGLIQEDALERGVQCMGELLGGAAEFGLGASQVRVVATAALRRELDRPLDHSGRGDVVRLV